MIVRGYAAGGQTDTVPRQTSINSRNPAMAVASCRASSCPLVLSNQQEREAPVWVSFQRPGSLQQEASTVVRGRRCSRTLTAGGKWTGIFLWHSLILATELSEHLVILLSVPRDRHSFKVTISEARKPTLYP